MRRVECGWVDKTLWWTFVLLQKLWECNHQSSFVQCVFFYGNIFAHALWAFRLTIQAWLLAIFSNQHVWSDDLHCQTFFRGSIHSMEKDLQQTLTNKPIVFFLFNAAICAFLDALTLHLSSCHIQIKFDLRYSFSSPAHVDMARLFAILNTFSFLC